MNKRKPKLKSRTSNLIIGIVMIGLLVLAAVFAKYIAPYAFDSAILSEKLQAPNSVHWFGTDAYGRDVFSRIIYGSRIALKVAVVSAVIQLVIGITVGLASGFFGGITDKILCFIMDITWSMPPLIMAFAVVSVLGKSLDNAIIAISVVSWAQYARIVRTKTMSIRNMAFLETGIAFGESNFALMFRYILPNIIPSLVVVASMSIPGAIMSTTSLSFLGLGAQAPSPDWGLALSESMAKVSSAPWLAMSQR
jgi:peptide/nickel transport system permease protein